jgi:hypothetical protein
MHRMWATFSWVVAASKQRSGTLDVLAVLYSADRIVWYSNTGSANKSALFDPTDERFVDVRGAALPAAQSRCTLFCISLLSTSAVCFEPAGRLDFVAVP